MIQNLIIIFFFFFLGYIYRKLKIFSENYSKPYIDFIMYVGFPALVINNIYHLKFTSDVFMALLTGWIALILNILFSYKVATLIKLDKKSAISFVMVATFANTGFLGYPFILSLYGSEGLRYAVIFDNLAMFLPIYILAPILISFAKDEKSFKVDLKKLLLFPPFTALLIALSLKPFQLPSIVLKILDMLGSTVIPLILFSVGMNLRFTSIKKDIKIISLVLLIKQILLPLTVLTILLLLGVSLTLPWKVAILQLSMPPMVLASIFVIEANLNKDIAVSSVALGIILSFLTVPLIYYIIENMV
ncbi:putative integral membrane protein [Sulfurihydrogenibium azorense Az-Fu1]|jgi:predicted permease|uniref:Putative integral membrane protein n=1 Tax=Sulfurihydrogenibium azorense (strain DSM 15241 / OCM 825 / Az-Fu1) TaxID=204536 RepID=C1DXT4_SULAA|nr:AEC family transporter [Sulfurihydrogenibium azorense]ACN99540.1 putative integral membrane protein [Sulfurihydrogenibium azorense Az-Fu1]